MSRKLGDILVGWGAISPAELQHCLAIQAQEPPRRRRRLGRILLDEERVTEITLARALALDPALLFLDEPTSGLDPVSAGAFDELVVQLKESLGLTVVMVTHDLDSLWHATDRVAFLGEKRVIGYAPMAELVTAEHPLIRAYFEGPRGRAARGQTCTAK